jgi:large subunit ribosomal protein L35
LCSAGKARERVPAVAICARFCHIAGLPPPGQRAAVAAKMLNRTAHPSTSGGNRNAWRLEHDPEKWVPVFGKDHASSLGVAGLEKQAKETSQMPKMKTKSGAKKRFKVTGTGKVMSAHAGKRHGMIKRTTKQIREHRGTRVLFKTDGDNVRKYFLPNG